MFSADDVLGLCQYDPDNMAVMWILGDVDSVRRIPLINNPILLKSFF